jgi:hypothetical protein
MWRILVANNLAMAALVTAAGLPAIGFLTVTVGANPVAMVDESLTVFTGWGSGTYSRWCTRFGTNHSRRDCTTERRCSREPRIRRVLSREMVVYRAADERRSIRRSRKTVAAAFHATVHLNSRQDARRRPSGATPKLGATPLTCDNFRRCRWGQKADPSRTARQSTDLSVAAKVVPHERSYRAAPLPTGIPLAAGTTRWQPSLLKAKLAHRIWCRSVTVGWLRLRGPTSGGPLR